MPPVWTRLAPAAILAAGLAEPALAEMRQEIAGGGHVLFYGQFDPAYQSFDDGVSDTGNFVDNGHSNSRVGVWIRQPAGEGEFSFNFETALGLRQSFATSQGFTPRAADWRRTSIRKADFAWKTPDAGTFYLGQGSVSTDGVADVDLSGTALVTYNSVGDSAGAFRFRTAAGALSARTIAQSFPNFDGGRRGRVRYDTPALGGFTVSASYGEEILARAVDLNTTNIALRYAGEAGAVTMRGALGYSRFKFGNGTTRHDTMGSFSLLHRSGVNVTLAGGSRKESGNYLYGKLGYRAQWFAAGTTSVSLDYYAGRDMTGAGSDSRTLGFGAVQSFEEAGIEAYLGYRRYELTETATTYRDASSVLFGARWKF